MNAMVSSSKQRRSADASIRVLMLSSMIPGEIIEYLDTGKVLVKDAQDEDIIFARPDPRPSTGKARTSSGRRSRLAGPPVAEPRGQRSGIALERQIDFARSSASM